VPDYYDKCPDTPKEAYSSIDADGCPLDTDGDGVFDYLDKCPDTPYQAYGTVDKVGCPKDTDKDGVPDYLDKCPTTPEAERNNVDTLGCTIVIVQPIQIDSVVDTVAVPVVVAKLDTIAVVRDIDTDGDGIVDRLDRCPQLAGVASNGGCPEIKKEVRVIFQKALQGIQFETAKFIIKPLSYVILQNVARVLSENPNYMVEIQGHTDNEGLPEKNQILSENRANEVREYLISKGIDAKRLTSNGYGQMRPIAPNSTIDGRAKNRRVEFVVSFE
jgi:outer membrane protein OmpA-like peptidoglycan-associated protein